MLRGCECCTVSCSPLVVAHHACVLADTDRRIRPIPGERLTLPASGGENFTVEARYFAVEPPAYATQPIKRPTIVLCNGYDASQEDIYHNIGVAALERGFNVITYEG